MKAPKIKPTMQLSGEDGNAFFIIGKARNTLQKAGADKEYIEQYLNEVKSGDYDNLIQVTMKYVECK